MGFGLGLVLFIGAGIRSIMIGCIAARITAIRIAMLRLFRVIVRDVCVIFILIILRQHLRVCELIIRLLRIIGVLHRRRFHVLILLGIIAHRHRLLHRKA